jgi:hypothetical protein
MVLKMETVCTSEMLVMLCWTSVVTWRMAVFECCCDCSVVLGIATDVNSGVVGGLELSCFDECLIAEEIAYGCTAIATAMGASNLGVSQIVMFSILM